MPNELKKITALPSGTPADTDVVPFVDLATNTTKKALKSELKGDKGDTGTAATVDAGTTTTLAAGQSASVTNVGTTSAAIFNFAIPQGIQGLTGADGACVESVAFSGNDIVFTLDDSSTVTLTNAKIDLKGDKGDTGAKITSAEFVGNDLVFTLDDSSTVTVVGAKTALKGDKGDTGDIGIDWQGAWSAGTYTVNQGVSHNGSSWIAKTTTTEEPSISATDWDLVALKGTDGADGVMASVVAGTGISVDATDPANPIVTADLSKVDTKPTDLKISTASKGGVLRNIDGAVGDIARTTSGWNEDEKFGFYTSVVAAAVSSEFDSAVTRTGRLTLKLSSTDVTGKAIVQIGNALKNYIPVKPSTTYTLRCFAKTNNVAASSVYIDGYLYDSSGTYSSTIAASNKLSGTLDWTPIILKFTTGATEYFINPLFRLYITGNVSDAWFDVNSMTLEEVVTDTTFTGKVAEKIRPVLQAVTSTDNIDQSLDPTGAYANTYALTNAVNEGATHIQTFTPTKKYTTRIGVWVVAKGTGNWTLVVHDASNIILASKTITNASLTEGAFNYFDVPNIWTSGALHFHLYSSVADGTCKANTSNDLETASYIHNYAKKSENFTVISNGIKTDLKADKDGLLSNAIIDLDNGKYRYDFIPNPNDLSNLNDIYSLSAATNPDVLVFGNGWSFISSAPPSFIRSGNGIGADRYAVWKINTILPIKNLKLGIRVASGLTRAIRFEYSLDGSNWATLQALTADLNSQEYVNTPLLNGRNLFYIRILKPDSNQHLSIYSFSVEADLDTSSIPQGLFYPIGVNQFAETWKATGTVLSYVYRKAKYTNEYGVVMPAIELNSEATGAGTALGYLPLKIDNSQETTPAITILASSGVASDTVLDADGEYVALSSGATEGSVNYQVTITKNTLYLSSNADSVDSTQDPSHQGNFIIGVRQQGLTDRVKDIGEETEDIKKGLADTKQLIRNNSLILAYDAGTTDAYEVTIADFEGYKAGLALIFKANTANTDGATLNINGMGAKAIVKGVDTALASNDILAGMYCQCIYDGTNFVLLNPRAL